MVKTSFYFNMFQLTVKSDRIGFESGSAELNLSKILLVLGNSDCVMSTRLAVSWIRLGHTFLLCTKALFFSS